MLITATDCSYSAGYQRAAESSFRRPLPQQASSKRSLCAVFPGNFKASLPQTALGKDRQQVNMTKGFSLAWILPFTRVRPLCPLGKTRAWHHGSNNKKSRIYDLAGSFFWGCPSQHLVIHSEAAPKPQRWKSGQGGSDPFDVRLHEAMTRM